MTDDIRNIRSTFVNRRSFLKIAGVAAVVVAAGAGGILGVKKILQGQLNTLKESTDRILIRQYGEKKGKIINQKIQQELEKELPRLPFLGSTKENKWASNMPPAALALSAYHVLVPGYATVEETGLVLYQAFQQALKGIPSFIMRTTYNEGAMISKLKALAARSQKRQYAEDWVMAFVEGNGQDFTYGVDVKECAIQKYLLSKGAPELTRYLCLTDLVLSEAMGRGLVRYKTLAEGCTVCDFRYKKGRPGYLHPLRNGWPPKFESYSGA